MAEIGVAICRGLAAAHRRGILHRELKPSNVIQGREGELKLADFGIAKLLARPQDTAIELAAVSTLPAGKDAHFVMTIPEALRPAMVASPQAATVQALEPPHVAAPQDVTMKRDPQAAAPDLQAPPPAPPAVPMNAADVPPADGNSPPADVEQSTVKGTPLYMAPEVLRGEPASYRSDIYSLGGCCTSSARRGRRFTTCRCSTWRSS